MSGHTIYGKRDWQVLQHAVLRDVEEKAGSPQTLNIHACDQRAARRTINYWPLPFMELSTHTEHLRILIVVVTPTGT